MPVKAKELFIKVNPKGGFFPVADPKGKPAPPTTIDFNALKLGPGRQIGLHRAGAIKYGEVFADDIASLWLRLNDTMETYELIEDQHIFAIPQIGSPPTVKPFTCSFGPRDTFYTDNTDPNNDYGVVVSFANTKPTNYVQKSLEDALSADALQKDDAGVSTASPTSYDKLPDFEYAENGFIFASDKKASPEARYRGWYENNTWIPAWSHYDGPRPGGPHKGVDVFAPEGTRIATPVSGILYLNPFQGGASNPSLGTHCSVQFKRDGTIYYAVFAHLDSTFGEQGQCVKAGQTIIGKSGHTGNAGSNLPCTFAQRNIYGGRSDHVHIDVRDTIFSNNKTYFNPVELLNLSIGLPI